MFLNSVWLPYKNCYRRLSSTLLRKIYPSKDVINLVGFSNTLFGDGDHCGKFLIELRDENVMFAIGISHYVSLDTEKLEIYDPMSKDGAIITQRNSDGYCLLLETLRLMHTVKILNVWKLFDKSSRTHSLVMSNVIHNEEPKKKKHRGQKRMKSNFYQ